MLKRLGLLAVLFALLSCMVLPAADGEAKTAEKPAAEKAAEPVWLESFEKAKETAKAEKKIILANFTGSDWCPWCIKLEGEVFGTAAFKTWAAKHVVLLKLDFPRKKEQAAEVKQANKALAEKYGVEGFPTVIFMDAEGKALGKSGYQRGGAESWIKSAETLVDQLKETSEAPAAKTGDGAAMAATTTTPVSNTGSGTAMATAKVAEAKTEGGCCSAGATATAIKVETKEAKTEACETKVATSSCCSGD